MINPNKAPLSAYTQVPGWESPSEQGLLLSLARSLDNSKRPVIVEIGSEFGMSASIFAKYMPPTARLFCIENDEKASFQNNIGEVELWDGGRMLWLLGDSSEIVKGWPPEWDSLPVIDLLFIDGDHSYGGALADLMNWSPFVSDVGVIAVHDCVCRTNPNGHHLHMDVRRAVDRWLKMEPGNRFDCLFTVDSTMVFGNVRG